MADHRRGARAARPARGPLSSARLAYLDALRSSYDAALATGLAPRSATLEIAGTAIGLEFAGDALAERTLPGLAPVLAGEAGRAPALTVRLWDSASAGGLAPPRPPWAREDGGRVGAVKGHNDESLKTVVDPTCGMVMVADLDGGRAAVWAPSPDALPENWPGTPLRMLLGWALRAPGRHLVHAGAVGAGGRGVLLAGGGGSGKSTLATACALGGMAFSGDDYVLLESGPPPVAHALYGSARLDRGALDRLPALRGEPFRGPYDKTVVDVLARAGAGPPPPLEIAAVVVPRRAANGPQLRRIPAGAALRALAPSTMFQAADGGADAFAVLAAVVRHAPAYELLSGPDVMRAPVVLRALLDGTS